MYSMSRQIASVSSCQLALSAGLFFWVANKLTSGISLCNCEAE